VGKTVIATLLCGSLGCATAHNYLDPVAPRYEGTLAPDRIAPLPATIRVVTFNIEYGLRIEHAVAALQRFEALREPDVLLLQEMDAAGVEVIARALRLNYVYYPASLTPKTGRDFGNAILSPWPIVESAKLPLPHPSRILHQARAAVTARIRVADLDVQVYCLHLGSPFGISGGQRRQQAAAVLADAKGRRDPVIIAGDINSKGLGQVFTSAGYRWPTEHVGASRGSFSFDHIFARGLDPVAHGAGVVREASDASDHRPVWTVFAVPPRSDNGGERRERSRGGISGEVDGPPPPSLHATRPGVQPGPFPWTAARRPGSGARGRERARASAPALRPRHRSRWP
jgi:endonuclease/exonuclease/phosphatase family metal-dependent hydrolase